MVTKPISFFRKKHGNLTWKSREITVKSREISIGFQSLLNSLVDKKHVSTHPKPFAFRQLGSQVEGKTHQQFIIAYLIIADLLPIAGRVP